MIRSAIKLLFVSICLLAACTSSPESQVGNQAKTPETVEAPPVVESLAPGEMPNVIYKTPSIDRSEKGKPDGSPFIPELLQEVFPLDAAGLNRFSAANGSPKLIKNQYGKETRMVYRNKDNPDQEVVLSIADSGTLGLTMDQIVDWIKHPRHSETEKTIDRTGALKGFPFYEYYVNEVQEGELHILVNKRFEVVARGRGVSYEALRSVVEDWDLSSLY